MIYNYIWQAERLDCPAIALVRFCDDKQMSYVLHPGVGQQYSFHMEPVRISAPRKPCIFSNNSMWNLHCLLYCEIAIEDNRYQVVKVPLIQVAKRAEFRGRISRCHMATLDLVAYTIGANGIISTIGIPEKCQVQVPSDQPFCITTSWTISSTNDTSSLQFVHDLLVSPKQFRDGQTL